MTGEISISGEAMRAVVAKAIMEGISADQRNLLIEQALQHLIEPTMTGDQWNRKQNGPSILQQAFDQAVAAEARDLVVEMLKEGPLADKIKTSVAETMSEVMMEDWTTADGIGRAIGEAVRDRLQRR